MGFKYSVMNCNQPQELVQVTLNHLDAISTSIGDTGEAHQCILTAIQSTLNIAAKLKIYDFHLIRHKLCSFFQDKNIKVSLFLTAGIQNRADGTFILELNGECPYGFDVPGLVKYYSGGKASAESITHPLETLSVSTANHLNTKTRNSNYGKNLYVSFFHLIISYLGSKPSAPDEQHSQQPQQQTPLQPQPEKKPLQEESPAKKTQTHVELNYLASLIGGASEKESKGNFKINLFHEEEHSDETPVTLPGGSEVIRFDIGKVKNQDLDDIMEGFDKGSHHAPKSDEEDLLDLLDQSSI